MSPRKTWSSSSAGGATLVCPGCGRSHPSDERFCGACGMPLVHSGGQVAEDPRDDAHGRARKIKPEYTEGRLVRVAGGRNQAEAELIQGLLIEEGVPSILRRSAGFDVPDFLAAGPRDVLVPESGAQAAHEVLLDADLAPRESEAVPAIPGAPGRHTAKLLAATFGGGLVTALVAWALLQLGA